MEGALEAVVACRCGRPTWHALTDLALELQAARERLALVDEDCVEWIATARHRTYQMLGGTVRTLASYRAEVRVLLAAGRDGFGEAI